MFAIEDIDPSLGRVRLDLVSFYREERENESVPVEMVDCRELIDEKDGTNYSNNENFDIEKMIQSLKGNFLCPKNVDEMIVQGNYGDDEFKFVKITVDGCQLSEEECQPIEAIDN